jgi:hypothetical protein
VTACRPSYILKALDRTEGLRFTIPHSQEKSQSFFDSEKEVGNIVMVKQKKRAAEYGTIWERLVNRWTENLNEAHSLVSSPPPIFFDPLGPTEAFVLHCLQKYKWSIPKMVQLLFHMAVFLPNL